MLTKVLTYSCLIWLYLFVNKSETYLLTYDNSVLEDASLKTPELIRKYGYKVQEHTVQTKDGYILTLYRIPNKNAQPVLLTHGLTDSSATWVLMGKDNGLAYLLYEEGFDVWMLNVRGTIYSRGHVKYNTINPKYWDFSFHELGVYDLPAAIDYVLNKTHYDQLHYIGHSQGTTAFFVMGSELPDYMKKIKLMQALAPVAYFEHIDGPLVRILSPYANQLYTIAKLIGVHQYPPEQEALLRAIRRLCFLAFRNTCMHFVFQTVGPDESQLNKTMLPVILGHVPAGASLKAVIHYAQLVQKGGFRKFDYGRRSENIWRHNSPHPTSYNLTNVNCKVALYYGQNDWLTAVRDVQRLRNELPNVVYDQLLAYRDFNHLDFVWATDAKELLYETMFDVMRQVEERIL